MIEAYPLYWPEGYQRTMYPEHSRFNTTFSKTTHELVRELNLFGATNVIISTNIPLRQDGLPYATARRPDDPGVAVYFTTSDGENVVFACDRWDMVQDNLRAIQRTIEALRGIDRWGVSDMLNRVFRGFAALPSGDKEKWYEVLGIPENSSLEEIKSVYRALARKYHPDNQETGDHDMFVKVQKAYEEAKNIK